MRRLETRVAYEVPLQVAAWATAHTGLSVAEHSAIAYRPDDFRAPTECVSIHGRFRPVPPIGRSLGKTGKRVLVINSVNPIMADDVNGIQVNDGRYTWPAATRGRRPFRPKSRRASSVNFPTILSRRRIAVAVTSLMRNGW